MSNSNWHCTCERIARLVPHPNATTLDLCYLAGPGGHGELGYTVVVKKGEFKEGQLVAYIAVDSLVPTTHPLFAWLAPRAKYVGGIARIKDIRLRGVSSMGLVVPLPTKLANGVTVGHDLSATLGVERWLSPQEKWALLEEQRVAGFAKTRAAKNLEVVRFGRAAWAVAACTMAGNWVLLPWQLAIPLSFVIVLAQRLAVQVKKHRTRKPNIPMYDISALRRNPGLFTEGEPVVITEKLHGCNARFVWHNGKLHVGSRTVWREPDNSVWWRIARQLNLAKIMRKYPNVVLYGEIVGPEVQDLGYGVPQGQVTFYAFDLMELATRKYWNYTTFKQWCDRENINSCPVLYTGPYLNKSEEMAEGLTMAGPWVWTEHVFIPHVREGIVIRPMEEIILPDFGRKLVKHVGEMYHERKVPENYVALEAGTRKVATNGSSV